LFIAWIPKFYQQQMEMGKILINFLGGCRQQPSFPPKLLSPLTKYFRQLLDANRTFGTVWGTENDVQPIILSCLGRNMWKFLKEICDQMKVDTTTRVEMCRLGSVWESTIINLGCLMVHFSTCYASLVMGLYDQRVPLLYHGMVDNWLALLSKFRINHQEWPVPLGGDDPKLLTNLTSNFIYLTLISRREMKCTVCRSLRLFNEFEIREGRWALMCRRCAVKCHEVPMLDPDEPMSRDVKKVTLFQLLDRMMNTSIDMACREDK